MFYGQREIYIYRERDRDTERQRERETERQRETERDRQRQTETDRETQRETERGEKTAINYQNAFRILERILFQLCVIILKISFLMKHDNF